MARNKYRTGLTSKVLIGVVGVILFASVVMLIVTISKNNRFNGFKNELSHLSGSGEYSMTAEYKGGTYEATVDGMSHLYSFLSNASRNEGMNSAKILDAVTVRFSGTEDEAVLTLSQTDAEYVKVTLDSGSENYTYWFKCAVGYRSLLKLTGAPTE